MWEKDQLFCKNKDCTSKSYKLIEHFAKTLKIKGLGPATISKLDIKNINELYALSYEAMVQILGLKTAEKLFAEINNSLEAPLNELLPALGIPLIGRSASNKICAVISHITDLSLTTCQKAGLGPKATENLLRWYTESKLEDLPFSFEATSVKNKKPSLGHVCISGKLKSFKTKALAKTALEEKGYIVLDNLTKEANILINESGIASTKTKKAQDLGIKIITDINQIL